MVSGQTPSLWDKIYQESRGLRLRTGPRLVTAPVLDRIQLWASVLGPDIGKATYLPYVLTG